MASVNSLSSFISSAYSVLNLRADKNEKQLKALRLHLKNIRNRPCGSPDWEKEKLKIQQKRKRLANLYIAGLSAMDKTPESNSRIRMKYVALLKDIRNEAKTCNYRLPYIMKAHISRP